MPLCSRQKRLKHQEVQTGAGGGGKYPRSFFHLPWRVAVVEVPGEAPLKMLQKEELVSASQNEPRRHDGRFTGTGDGRGLDHMETMEPARCHLGLTLLVLWPRGNSICPLDIQSGAGIKLPTALCELL